MYLYMISCIFATPHKIWKFLCVIQIDYKADEARFSTDLWGVDRKKAVIVPVDQVMIDSFKVVYYMALVHVSDACILV